MSNFNNNRNNYRNGNDHQFNNRGNGQNRFNNRPRMSDEERERRAMDRQAKLETQKNKLDIIENSIEFFNMRLSENADRVSMKELYDFLSNEKNVEVENAKKASDIIYLIIDLVNARCNREIKANTGDRINIRILYIIERFKTAFDKSYHERIGAFIDKYPVLFAWNAEATGDNYDVEMSEKTEENIAESDKVESTSEIG